MCAIIHNLESKEFSDYRQSQDFTDKNKKMDQNSSFQRQMSITDSLSQRKISK